MVTVGIVGVLAAVATISVSRSEYGQSVKAYAEQIAAVCDLARERAVATRRWQHLEITATELTHWQVATEGMGQPDEWRMIQRLDVPRDITVVAADNRALITTGRSDPLPGAGLPAEIDFGPDGSGTAATVFISDPHNARHSRVIVYRATGTAYVLDSW